MNKKGRSRSVGRSTQNPVLADKNEHQQQSNAAISEKKPEDIKDKTKPEPLQPPAEKPQEESIKPRHDAVSKPRPAPPPEDTKRDIVSKGKRDTPRDRTLQQSRYMITVYRWKVLDGTSEVKGTILSQTLQKLLSGPAEYAGDITLAALRKMTPGMSPNARTDKFCMADGAIVTDETIALDEYMALNREAEDDEAEEQQPSLPPKQPEEPEEVESKEIPSDGKAEHAKELDQEQADTKTDKPASKLSVPRLALYYRSTTSQEAAQEKAARVDAAEKAVAPELDMKLSDNPSADGLETLAAPGPVESTIAKDETLKAASKGNDNATTAGTLTAEEWTMVLRNCSVFYGWKIDTASQRIIRAPRAAFRLRVADETSTLGSFQPMTKAKDPLDEASYYEDADDDDEGDHQVVNDRSKFNPLHKLDAPPGIPNFRTNDASKIEVTACSSSLAVSLANSDFSSNSTEASANGGFGGVTVGVSAGYAESKSSAHKEEHEDQTQTLVARYLYPRCDIFLRPEDLEPTPEFQQLLRRVSEDKSLDALRQIQAQYGQLFCQELTLGARLLSTKSITASKDASVDSQKESFKVSVGVSVQTPYGGASMKHEEEKGSTSDKKRTVTESKEMNVFEANGGDTILANDPSAWADTVANPALWRVINREGLSTLVDMLSEMPGYQAAQLWFVQAIPALSKYIRLNAGLATHVRFKIESPTNSLACQNDGSAMFYLGCTQGATVTPRLMGRESTLDAFWFRIDLPNSRVLFHPSTYRAPTIFGFKDFKVGDSPFGSQYNAAFTGAQWELISPFGVELPGGSPYELKNMARVILRTVPFRDPAVKLLPDGTDPTPPPSHMVVYRNVQGVFVPAVSDNDEYQYWRIEKTDDSPAGTPIKGGDSIRLSWRFADQVVGFRDYKDDVFGRRRNCCPSELESSKLYMKVPWPRFEKTGEPTALVMSAQGSRENVAEALPVIPGAYNYLLQDLTMRIDTVENNGIGDSRDYMLRGLTQGLDQMGAETIAKFLNAPIDYTIFPRSPQNPLQVWSKIAALGTIDAPVPQRTATTMALQIPSQDASQPSAATVATLPVVLPANA